MQHLKKILIKIVYPRAIPTVIIIAAAAILLIYTCTFEKEITFIAYISYIFSTYALVVVVCKIPGIVKKGKQMVYANPYTGRYLTDKSYRIGISLYWSVIINSVYVVIKLFLSLFYHSVWFGAIAMYYLILCLIRLYLLFQVRRQELSKNRHSEYKTYRLCGIFLLTLNVALTYMVIQMVHDGQTYRYPGMLIYLVALYTFYSIIIAVINLIIYHKYNSPLISAVKAVSFTTAAVSILSLQTAMLTEFGQDFSFGRFMNSATGGVVCLLILGTAFYMIVNATWQLRKFH